MKTFMKCSLSSALTLALTTFAATAGADGGVTRETVKAELAEAIRTGNISAGGESGLTLRELHPEQYPAQPKSLGLTRAQVRAELAEARRTGDLMASGQSGYKLNELYPQKYPAKALPAPKTRAEVMAELEQARLLGELQVGEDSRTLVERDPQRYAAARAKLAATLESQYKLQSANATGTAR